MARKKVLKVGRARALAIRRGSAAKRPNLVERRPEFVVIYHPGRGTSSEEIRSWLTTIRLREKIEFIVGEEEQDEEATLISPFGTFRGREHILDGISAIKSLA